MERLARAIERGGDDQEDSEQQKPPASLSNSPMERLARAIEREHSEWGRKSQKQAQRRSQMTWWDPHQLAINALLDESRISP
jgi:hypothetical protein